MHNHWVEAGPQSDLILLGVKMDCKRKHLSLRCGEVMPSFRKYFRPEVQSGDFVLLQYLISDKQVSYGLCHIVL